MSPMALEFAEHCRSFFGVAHAPGMSPWRQYAPANPQS
jgi:hypothetical protein